MSTFHPYYQGLLEIAKMIYYEIITEWFAMYDDDDNIFTEEMDTTDDHLASLTNTNEQKKLSANNNNSTDVPNNCEMIVKPIVTCMVENDYVKSKKLKTSDSMLVVSYTVNLLLQENFIDNIMANKIFYKYKLPEIALTTTMQKPYHHHQQEQQQEQAQQGTGLTNLDSTLNFTGKKYDSTDIQEEVEVFDDDKKYLELIGWKTIEKVRKTGKTKGAIDTYWLSPKKGYKFSSLNQVKKFIKLLHISPSEESAYHKYRQEQNSKRYARINNNNNNKNK